MQAHLLSPVLDNVEIISMWDKSQDEWLAARTRIGGSDIGSLAGLNPYASPFSVFVDKVHGSSFSGNAATELGNHLEAPVGEIYAKETNSAVVDWPVLFRATDNSYAAANVDRFIVDESPEFPAGKVTRWESLEVPPGLQAVLEIKTGALASPGKPYEWFEGGESVPLSYAAQGLWYLSVTGLPRVEFGALIGGHGFITRTLHRDEQLIADLKSIAESFWFNHIEPQIPPEPDGSAATEEALKTMYPSSKPGAVIEGGSDLAQAWKEFEESKAVFAEAEAAKKKARAKIVSIIGEAEVATVDGVPLCSFKSSKPGSYFADKILQAEDVETYNKYVRTKAGHRTLRAVGGK
jgi:putative phage-type endonuclease